MRVDDALNLRHRFRLVGRQHHDLQRGVFVVQLVDDRHVLQAGRAIHRPDCQHQRFAGIRRQNLLVAAGDEGFYRGLVGLGSAVQAGDNQTQKQDQGFHLYSSENSNFGPGTLAPMAPPFKLRLQRPAAELSQ